MHTPYALHAHSIRTLFAAGWVRDPLQYADLAALLDRIEATSSRLETTALLVEVFDAAGPEVLPAVLRLLQGKVAPDWEGIELGLAEKMILRALSESTGRTDVTEVYHDIGDLGLAAESLLAAGGAKQATLFGASTLSVQEVFARLQEIAASTGAGSQARKQKILQQLLAAASPLEARYIIRTVAGRARLGIADMTVLDALAAWHLGRGVRSVQDMEDAERAEHEDVRKRLERAYDVRSDLVAVAGALTGGGLAAVDGLQVRHGTPLRPMAAERLKTLAEILEKHGGSTAVETKYDGLRLQCHVSDGDVKLFSRRMEELTAQFPDVQDLLRAAFPDGQVVVEGEAVAVDAETGRMRPFQDISRRRGRKTGLGEGTRAEAGLAGEAADAGTIMDEVPVALYLFDCMAIDGESLMDRPYAERRALLDEYCTTSARLQLAAMTVCPDEPALEAVFQQSVADGGEGIMCKALDAPYKAGNRGFDWIKFKADYDAELTDSMDLVVIGAFHGRGRRAGWYGALLMAAYDPGEDVYRSVCKLGTGFDDETLMGLKDRFEEVVVQEKPGDVDSTMQPDVWLRPEVVMEVEAAELTVSPTHRAAWGRLGRAGGLAARFPRFTGRWRDDKAPDQATTVDELLVMYEQQGAQA